MSIFSGAEDKGLPLKPAKVPDEMADRTVKSIVETCEAQLELQIQLFHRQAKQIAQWDRSIYESLALIEHLENAIKSVQSAQTELAHSAASLLTEQEAFIASLEEKNAGTLSDTTDTRQRLYRLAADLNESFIQMEGQLRSLAETTPGVIQDEASSEVEKLLQISNCHLDAMWWINAQTADLEAILKAIERKLPRSA